MFLIPGLSQIQTLIVLLVVSFLTGFSSGWYTKGKFVEAEQVAAARAAAQQTKESATQARVVDRQIEQAQEKLDERGSKFNQEIKKNVRKTQPRKPVAKPVEQQLVDNAHGATKPADLVPPDMGMVCPADVLPLGAVRLLNDAAAGRQPDSARYGNAESQAPSDVGMRELSEYANKVISAYHDLATKHDALVDWVDKELAK